LYKTLALATLLYGSEIWTLKQCDKNRLRTAEMKYLRRTAGYTLLDFKRNEEILEELHVTSLEEKLCTYRHKWFWHVYQMQDYSLPKQLKVSSKGKTTWMTTEESTRRRKCWDRNRLACLSDRLWWWKIKKSRTIVIKVFMEDLDRNEPKCGLTASLVNDGGNDRSGNYI
jgi:hypothetical protein